MFTGLVVAEGRVAAGLQGRPGRLEIAAQAWRGRTYVIGESIAVNGVCLTVVEARNGCFAADVSAETCARTTLGALAVGAIVNLEPALRAGDALGGHMVSGHVDGVATVESFVGGQEGARLRLRMPGELLRYVARKGSVCVDGVSLTVNGVEDPLIDITLVPHTLACTGLRTLAGGRQVNVEIDLVARYVERLLSTAGASTGYQEMRS
ncbi:MAG: riboflavin synthase [Gammaproteobacteria bacterium]|nr:riboflavin synthase [Gammaproteobacteria bacterium]